MRTRTKAALWLVLTFLAGAALGGSAAFFTLQRVSPPSASPRVSERQPPPPDRVARRINERAKLNLSESQIEKVAEILAASRDRVNQATTESSQRIEAIREATNEEIRRVLDMEQRPKFDQQLKDWLERRRKRQESGEVPPGHPPESRPGPGGAP